MDKASKTAIVARHEPTGLYFSKQAGLTENLFNALSFGDPEDAIRYWTQSLYRPQDIENYKLYHMVTTKEVVESEQTDLHSGMVGRTKAADENGRGVQASPVHSEAREK